MFVTYFEACEMKHSCARTWHAMLALSMPSQEPRVLLVTRKNIKVRSPAPTPHEPCDVYLHAVLCAISLQCIAHHICH